MNMNLDSHVVGPLPYDPCREPDSLDEEVPAQDVKGSNLFELFTVSIVSDPFKMMDAAAGLPHTTVPELHVFGYILLNDDIGNQFYVFCRDRDDAKSVLLPESNSVILQKYDLRSPRCLPKAFKLQIHLEDKLRNIVLVDDWKFMSFTRDVTFDTDLHFSFDREHCFGSYISCVLLVHFEFTIFRCALSAVMGLSVHKTDNDINDVFAQVKGKISTNCKRGNMTCFERVLYNQSQDLNFDSLFKLCTLPVPADSFLKFQAKLDINGEKFDSDLEFEAKSWSWGQTFKQKIVGEKYDILIYVSWWHGFSLPEYDCYEWRGAVEEVQDFFSSREVKEEDISDLRKIKNIKGKSKRLKLNKEVSDNVLARQLAINMRNRYLPCPLVLVEVFSISCCSYDGEVSIYGKISSYDGRGKFIIFERGEKEPLMLLSSDTIPLVEPSRCYWGPHFGINLDLKDGQGRQICFGHVCHVDCTVDRWLDRRICSVVRGKHGFATVHYAIFHSAIQAELSFIVESISGSAVCSQVRGSLIATYSNFRYSTSYDKEYCQSVLFKKGPSECVNLDGDKIPLGKSNIAVSVNDILIVMGEICVLIDGRYVETLRLQSLFDPSKPREQPKAYEGSNYRLSVSVVWGR